LDRPLGLRRPRRPRPFRAHLFRLLILALLVLATAAGCKSGKPEVKLIAVVVDLTGPGRAVGQEVHDAARMALREAERKNRVGVELLVQDDRGDPDRAMRLAGYLSKLPEVVAVIGPSSASTTERALAVYGGKPGVPTLVPIPLEAQLVKNGDHVFGLAPSAEYLGETLAWFMVTELSADSATTLVASDPFGLALERGFGGELGRLGGGTLGRVVLGAGGTQRSLTGAALQAPAAVVSARPEAAVDPITTLLNAGYRGHILLAGAPPIPLPAAPDSSGGIYFPLFFNPVGDAQSRSFATRFEATYGRPAGEPAALAYDGVNLVLEAVEAGAADRQAVLRWLQGTGPSTSFQGVSGRFFFSREHFAVRDVAVASLGAASPVATRVGETKPSPAVPAR
jgi:ABC-type branched-subunit amino acid transport system substrate-binding protein